MKHIDVAAHLVGGAQQRGVAADGIDALARPGRPGRRAWAAAPPRSGRRPSRRSRRRRCRAPAARRARRPRPADRRSATPAMPRARRRPRTARRRERELHSAADAASCRISAAPNGASSLASAGRAMGGRGRNALQPQQGDRLRAERRGRRARFLRFETPSSGTCAAPDTSNGEPERRRHRPVGG